MRPADPPRTLIEGGAMDRELEEAAAEVDRLTRLRDEAEKGSAEHRELNAKLVRARKRQWGIQFGRREPRRRR
jgi:hypothetical protein